MQRLMLDGNASAAEAMRLARVQVISAYPITPQSPMAEKLASYVAEGKLNAKYIRVESEHSALSCAIGAQLTGVRSATATSSVGLALMHEVLGVAAGCRVPIVMPVVNRSLVSPWSLWCDHQDTMSERDTGWIQLYAESAQEVLDFTLMAYKIAEDKRVLLPTMVCLDGFFLSHMSDAVYVPTQQAIDTFLPAYKPSNAVLDPENPIFINDLTPSSEFTEMRFQQHQAFKEALSVIPEVMDEFSATFSRGYDLIENYYCYDADVVVVTLGSMSGTAKYVVDKLRAKGQKVGMLKIIAFRPFPAELIRKYLGSVSRVGIIERMANLGADSGPVCAEVKSALKDTDAGTKIKGFVAGLGGRDVPEATFEKAFDMLAAENFSTQTEWLDVKENALFLREVAAHA